MSKKPKAVLVRRAPRPRALRPGDAHFDAQASKELRRRARHVEALRVQIDEKIWEQGLELMVIRDQRLYRQAGYSGFSTWVVQGLGRSRDFAAHRIRIAEGYLLEHVRRYGLDLLEDASRYAELTASNADEDWSPKSLVLKVPIAGHVREIRFQDATAADLEAALGHQLELLAAREEAAIPRLARDTAEHVRSALAVPDSARTLADVRLRAADTGLVEDTRVSLHLRYGDLRSVIVQLARALLGSADPVRVPR